MATFKDEVEEIRKQILAPQSGITSVPSEQIAKELFGTDFTGINAEAGTGAFRFDESARERLRGITSPVTTSAEANAGLDNIDARLDGLPQFEEPAGAGEAGKVITTEREFAPILRTLNVLEAPLRRIAITSPSKI